MATRRKSRLTPVIVTRADKKSPTLASLKRKPLSADSRSVDPAMMLIDHENALNNHEKRIKRVERQVGTATPLPRGIKSSEHVHVTVHHQHHGDV